MSSWMQVTGWTLAHFVWQGGLIALMVAATLRLGRRWPSNARYVIACGGLIAMLVVPIATALVLSSTSFEASDAHGHGGPGAHATDPRRCDRGGPGADTTTRT